ncbi:flagellar basal body P-ring protein FlgI [Azospirillum brasilense]|uniref:Flagellar P-ring protein n=2 Tax=Azospirillum brasilense TaxID=192 RepID=A0A0P0FAK9_AZOBR|nr:MULTISPECIES: flagellar basal body P-ring protein FlgI [Azospirillum]ALJ36566.1 flagellar biosynthesis protein FlgA [Azospirillum brasilense]MDW7555027.1 flagellar basal body P-ring protein FlgI [Azospirillum brasilense]MDW7594804.1 flagellar basal body P-ring protein FlgI [Azospirillum brasilense]MDW7629658.1 flagellar basal body P-ring protein FlgI [Azospirillum brasilense]MDX5954518.1 flagellar basal body P-ring protein FlgI [Azospirillum brasilense]
MPRAAVLLRAVAMLAALAAALLALSAPASASSARIKDVVDVEGVRDNMLIGYGLVVGLNGTGDSLNNSPFTEQSLVGMLERMGVNTRGTNLRTKNVAAVMVTATLPPYSAQGTRIDATVSAMGDSKSLLGGTLLVTPLLGADGEVYAVAQGPIAVSGFSAQGQGASVTRGVPTSGRISSGAIVEREIQFSLAELPVLRLSLRNPDFTTAQRVATAINIQLRGNRAQATDPSSVLLSVPEARRGDIVGLITEIEQLRVTPDQIARVVVDEKSGVIVMGENVRISTVAIAQGNLTIRVTETPQVSQPGPFSQGQTAVVPRTDIQVDDQSNNRLAVMNSGVTLQELVQSLNALGVGPRDMIAILQSIKAAGALQAEIEVI